MVTKAYKVVSFVLIPMFLFSGTPASQIWSNGTGRAFYDMPQFLTIALNNVVDADLSTNERLLLADLKTALYNIQIDQPCDITNSTFVEVISEMSKANRNSEMIAGIEYINEVMIGYKRGRPLEDVADIVKTLIDTKKNDINDVMAIADFVSGQAQSVLMSTRAPRDDNSAKKNELQERQDYIHNLGIEKMKYLNCVDAVALFKEAVYIDAKSPTAALAMFNMAWCAKIMGDLKESANYFNSFLSYFPSHSLAKDAMLQLALLERRGFRYKESVDLLVELADRYNKSLLAPIALYQAASTYVFDLNDENTAMQILERLITLYPASDLASRGTFLYQRLFVAAPVYHDIYYRIADLMWDEGILTAATHDDKQSTGQAAGTNSGESSAGPTESITAFINKELKKASKNTFMGFDNVSVKYKMGNRIEVNGIVTMGGIKLDGHISGRLSSNKQGGYVVEECRLGRMNIPAASVNSILKDVLFKHSVSGKLVDSSLRLVSNKSAFSELVTTDQRRAHNLFTRRKLFNIEGIAAGSSRGKALISGWQGTGKSQGVEIKKISARSRGADRVELEGLVSTGGVDWDAQMVGSIKMIDEYKRDDHGELVVKKALTYTAKECRFGGVNVPVELVNEALKDMKIVLSEDDSNGGVKE